jgi:hypothetical protein
MIMTTKISAAFVKAQSQFGAALKTNTNPHFKSRYADLSSCVEAVIDALNSNGIALIQQTHECESGVAIETVFLHESGEELRSGKLWLPASKQDAQGYGSALTYARRYSLMAACGIAPEDDDGNAASKSKPAPTSAKSITRDEWDKLSIDDQEALRSLAVLPISMLAQGNVADASAYIKELGLEATMQTAFWHLFESSHRSALKKYREENHVVSK